MRTDRKASRRSEAAVHAARPMSCPAMILPLCFFFCLSLAGIGQTQTPPVRVVFSGQASGGSWDLYLASGDGTDVKRAMETPGVDERTPVLSPDRKFVAYSTSRGELQLYNLYDRVARTLPLPSKGRAAWPAWGPDGASLYYVDVQMGKGPDEGTVWRYEVPSNDGRKMADVPEVEGWPAVSDDGVLLFTTWTQEQSCSLSSMAPSAQAPTLLWDRSLSLSGAAQLPGGRIAAVAGDAAGQKVILLRNGRAEREFDVPGASGRPVNYQGGLLLTRIESGAAGIHVMDLATGKTRPWTNAGSSGPAQMRDPDYR